MNTSNPSKGVPVVEIYKSIRTEVIEQKKCQFQILTASIAFTSAMWAYAARDTSVPQAFLAPIALNLCGLLLIFDKAVSIQRMVGYLQLIETKKKQIRWAWEHHLDEFRGLDPTPLTTPDPHDSRKHSYVTTVGRLLLLLSFISCGLYVFFAIQATKVSSVDWFWQAGCKDVFFLISLLATLSVSVRFWWLLRQLCLGKYSSSAIRKRWEIVLS